MNPDRLRNLLQKMEVRLTRTEKAVSALDRKQTRIAEVMQGLSALKVVVRRHGSKPDALRMVDVSDIESRFNELRDVADRSLSAANHRQNVELELRAILLDEIGFRNLIAGLKIGLNQLGPDDLLEIVPGQKTAAFQFGFVEDLLVVVDQPLLPNKHERDMALAALETAIQEGDRLNQDLAQTNVSPRLRGSFARLQEVMQTHTNIVQVGSLAQRCTLSVHAESEELSKPLLALMLGHLQMVSSALAQFEEWRVFSENAVSTNLDLDSVRKLAQSAKEMSALFSGSASVDPSVADALNTVSDWATDQEKPDKRDVLSLARTIENIWSVLTRIGLGLSSDVASESRKMVARIVIGFIVAGIVKGLVAISKIPGAEWIETAYTYFTTITKGLLK